MTSPLLNAPPREGESAVRPHGTQVKELLDPRTVQKLKALKRDLEPPRAKGSAA